MSQGARRVQADTHEMREDIPKDMRQFNSTFARAKAARRGWRQMTGTAFLGTNPKVVYFRVGDDAGGRPGSRHAFQTTNEVPLVPRSWGPGMPQRLAAWKLGCDDSDCSPQVVPPPGGAEFVSPALQRGERSRTRTSPGGATQPRRAHRLSQYLLIDTRPRPICSRAAPADSQVLHILQHKSPIGTPRRRHGKKIRPLHVVQMKGRPRIRRGVGDLHNGSSRDCAHGAERTPTPESLRSAQGQDKRPPVRPAAPWHPPPCRRLQSLYKCWKTSDPQSRIPECRSRSIPAAAARQSKPGC